MSEREAENMQKAIENYAKELAKERVEKIMKEYEEFERKYAEERAIVAVKTVKNMLDIGINIETALKCFNIDRQTYDKYSKKLQ